MYTTFQNFGVSKVFLLFIFPPTVSYAHQSCIYLIKQSSAESSIIVKYYYSS